MIEDNQRKYYNKKEIIVCNWKEKRTRNKWVKQNEMNYTENIIHSHAVKDKPIILPKGAV